MPANRIIEMITPSAVKSLSEKIDLTEQLSHIIDSVTKYSPKFSHIDIRRILICVSSNRGNRRGGIYGKLVPLKFKNGEPIQKYRGRFYTIPRIINNGIEQLYIVYFYIPKFFDLPPFEKLKVVFHELYHISEEFNGDIRRMGGKKKAHGFSAERYNSLFMNEVHDFHEFIQNSAHCEFLKMDTAHLQRNYKKIYCRRLKTPRPVILDEN